MRTNEATSPIAGWLDDIEFYAGALITARENLDNAVQHALDAGATWQAIGGTLGITRQAAQQRFS